jgi:hypothetical protein
MRKAASALLAGGVRLLSSRSGGICLKTSGQNTLGQSLQVPIDGTGWQTGFLDAVQADMIIISL